MLDSLNIVKDCWWVMPSGTKYLIDENDQLSSQVHGLYTSLNDNDSQYIRASNSGEVQYYGRLETTNIKTTALYATLRAECQPPGSAILNINNYEMAVIPISGGVHNYSTTVTLTDAQKERIHYGRIDKNYDYFDIKLGSHQPPTLSQIKLYDLNITYSGDVTWDNHKTGLPNVFIETYYPQSIKVSNNTRWTGGVSDVTGIHVSGVDNTYLEFNGSDHTKRQNFKNPTINQQTNSAYGAHMPSGYLSLTFDDITSSSIIDPLYDEYGEHHGSGVGIGLHSYKNIAPSGLGGYSIATSGSVGHYGFGEVLAPGSGDYSIECWIKTTDAAGAICPAVGASNLVGVGNTDRWYIGLNTNHTGRVYCEYEGAAVHFNGTTVINDGKWHHLATTLKRDTNQTLYVDGSGQNTASIAIHEGLGVEYGGLNEFKIGWGYGYTDRKMNVAGVRVYRAALTSEEVATRASGLPIDTKPVAEWTFNRQITEGLDPFTQITRARMNLRASLPLASGDNKRDTLEINGYNSLYKNQDYREELAYVNASQTPRNSARGYYLYGAGPIIEQSGFQTYNVELNFLDPMGVSGDYKSIKHANADMLAHTEFQLIGIPSGIRLSAAELQIEYIPDEFIPLYTVGSSNITRCLSSGVVDAGTSESYSAGHGGWHHQGWRVLGPNVIEEDVFTNFYTFSEGEGYTRTYPETTKTYYFPAGDEDSTVYADYVQTCPRGIEGNDGDVTSLLKSPQRREYYRNPISASDLTPAYESNLRNISSFKPHYYRHMIYHGAAFAYVDVELGDGDSTTLDTDDLCQIYFEDRLGLDEDFTLYFVIYRDYGFQSYGRFFHRGLTEIGGIQDYEIYGDLEQNLVRFTIQGANGTDNRVEVEINQYTKEPILIWFSCGYQQEYEDMTTMKLSVHQDTKNYFSRDWAHSENSFTGRRKQYSSSSVRTTLGTLETLTVYEQMARRLYLHHASPVEFGYKAGEAIELDYTTSSSSTKSGYDTSESKDKYFLRSRIATSQYMQHNPSGVRWVVPHGSGEALWRTRYNIFESLNPSNIYSIYNPVSTAGTNHIVNPSAVYVELDLAHSTDHPSGLTVNVDVEFDSGTTDNWKVAHTTLENIPSGGAIWTQYAPIQYNAHTSKHINMNEGEIEWTDLENINITLTTQYPGDGVNQYNGSVEIRSLRVYFDSYCIAATGINDLDLYVEGGANTLTEPQLDLYLYGKQTTPSNIGGGSTDLYIHGIPYYASGDITLFTQGKWPTVVSPDDDSALNLFIEGWNPPKASGDLQMYIWGTTNPAIREFGTLFTKSNLDPRFMLPLIVDGGTGEETASMNLFLDNHPPSINNSLNLYTVGPNGFNDIYGGRGLEIYDDGVLVLDGAVLILGPDVNVTNLYIQGKGVNDGYYVSNSNMNLFMARDTEAVASRLSLFMAQKSSNNNISLFTEGMQVASSSVPLYISGSGSFNNTIKLYTHGF